MSLRTPTGANQTGGQQSDGTTHEGESIRPEATDSDEGGLSDSDIFDILRNSRRRAVISHLLQEGEQASVKELTEEVAIAEYDVTKEELSSDQHKRVYTGLYQCHLPRLDDFGVVDFDKDDKTVTLRDSGATIEPYLYRSSGSSAVGVELGVAVFVAAAATLGVFDVGVFGTVPATSWAILTVLSLVGLALFRLSQ